MLIKIFENLCFGEEFLNISIVIKKFFKSQLSSKFSNHLNLGQILGKSQLMSNFRKIWI